MTDVQPALTWRPIPGFVGLYDASQCGQVRRRAGRDSIGRPRRERILRQSAARGGYRVVSLSRDATAKTYRVHRLVALAWLGPSPEGLTINHRDGRKDNNAVSNLEYCTPSENTRHAVENGLHPQGEGHWCAKLTAEQVVWVRRKLFPIAEQAALLGVHTATIERARTGRSWRSLPPASLSGTEEGEWR